MEQRILHRVDRDFSGELPRVQPGYEHSVSPCHASVRPPPARASRRLVQLCTPAWFRLNVLQPAVPHPHLALFSSKSVCLDLIGASHYSGGVERFSQAWCGARTFAQPSLNRRRGRGGFHPNCSSKERNRNEHRSAGSRLSFALLVEALFAAELPLSGRRRAIPLLSGLSMIGWIVLLRVGLPAMAISPLIPRLLTLGTIAASLALEAWLRHSPIASLQPAPTRHDPLGCRI